MKKKLFILALFSFVFQFGFAQNPIRKINIDITNFRQQLASAKQESVLSIGNAKNSETIITLPLPDGTSSQFKVVEYSILPAGVNSDAKTYLGEEVGNSSIGCRITVTKEKLHATIRVNGQIIVIERDSQSVLSSSYNVYSQTEESFECNANETLLQNGRIKSIDGTQNYTNGSILRTYRMALVVTNELYVAMGNSDIAVNNQVVAVINNLNGLYEKEVSVRFTLTSPIDPESTNIFYRKTENTDTYYQQLTQTQNEIDIRYGIANYDIGHTLHTTGGGLANLASLCKDTYKGRGWSGSVSPSTILILAHEIGHQLSAQHTFNGNGTANCSIRNRSTANAYEPGSGTTIMSYFNLCTELQNLKGMKELYFHTNSLESMINYISFEDGNTCGVANATGNAIPVVNAGSNYTIPKNTPFTLIGSATDANDDVLSYAWEEYDQPVAADSGKLGHTNNAVNSTTAPLFRSRLSLSGVRHFPNMAFVTNNSNNPPDTEGEDLPNVGRNMVFRLTVRDNRGGVNMSSVTITVDASRGPLSVTLPNGNELWAAGSSKTIVWNVNNTNALSANVKILLSIDGGLNFPYVLLASTPNNGIAEVTIPSNLPETRKARIKIASTNSSMAEFFDVSNGDFVISSVCEVASTVICSETPVGGNKGSEVFNLGLSLIPGSFYTNKSKTVSFAGQIKRPTVVYTSVSLSVCNTYSTWLMNSQVLAFKVTQSGTYNIKTERFGFSIFSSQTFNCSTFLGSNACTFENTNALTSFLAGVTMILDECTTYYLLVYNPGSSSSFTVNFSGPGDIIENGTQALDFSNTFVAVNQADNQIAAVSASSNFTSLSEGKFLVYGFTYANGFNTNTLLNKTMAQAYALGSCVGFSINNKQLIVRPPCPTDMVLISPDDDISADDITKQASAINGKITATNFVTGLGTVVTYQAKAIELNAGFKAEQGTVFKAETGGCN